MDIYIARTCGKGSENAFHLFSERVFDSYEKAYAYLKEEFFDVHRARHPQYYGEIVSHINDDAEIISECYDAGGKLICKRQLHPAAEKLIVYVTPDFTPQYAAGDIVTVTGSFPFDERIGVVSGPPPTWDELHKYAAKQDLSEETRSKLQSKFEAAYLVNWISDSGYMRHDHVYEYEMRSFEGKLPEKLEFLNLLSRHYRKAQIIPEKKHLEIFRGEIYLFPSKVLHDIGVHLPSVSMKHTVAEMYSAHQMAVYEESVGLILWDTESGKQILLDRLSHFTDKDNIKLYCRAPYVCVVENRGMNGLVVNTDTGETHSIKRGDYHEDKCSYPIGFAEQNGEILLLHATDWNRLDITRLSDFTFLTPRELTEENSIDYFHSLLTVSPDGRHFAVDGWIWSPMESIEIYDVERFFTEYDKASVGLDSPEHMSGYNWDRPLCWVDDHTVAIGHNPNEGISGAEREPSRILLYDISQVKVMERFCLEKTDGTAEPLGTYEYYPQTESIPFDGFPMSDDYNEVWGELYYDDASGCFIGLNSETGLLISDREGKVLRADPNFKDWQYSPKFRAFYLFKAYPYYVVMKPLDEII